MFFAFLGAVLILHVSSIAGHGNREYELPGGIKVVVVTSSQDSRPRPEPHRYMNQQGVQIIQLDKYGSHNSDRDSNTDIPKGLWDYLKLYNATGSPGSSGVQVIRLGSDNGPKKSSHEDDDDDSLRKIFKLFRFGSRREKTESHPNIQYVFGRGLGQRRHLAQDRSDYDYPSSTTSQVAVPRTRVKVIRQNVPRRMLVRNLRASQAHLTNMQTLSFPVYEDEWQVRGSEMPSIK